MNEFLLIINVMLISAGLGLLMGMLGIIGLGKLMLEEKDYQELLEEIKNDLRKIRSLLKLLGLEKEKKQDEE